MFIKLIFKIHNKKFNSCDVSENAPLITQVQHFLNSEINYYLNVRTQFEVIKIIWYIIQFENFEFKKNSKSLS